MVSVCLATYNGEKYLREQLDSIICQLSDTDELIISDDGSGDATIDIVKSYHDNRIRLFENKGKHGFISNFENALKQSVGEIILLSDQDDIWKPNKVRVVTDSLKSCDLVVHDAELVDKEGRSIGKTYYQTMHKHTGFVANLLKPRFLGCCMAFNRKVLNKALPLVERRGHDYWIGMIAIIGFKVSFVDDILISYRRHGGNVTTSSEKSDKSLYKKYLKRLNMIYELLRRIIIS